MSVVLRSSVVIILLRMRPKLLLLLLLNKKTWRFSVPLPVANSAIVTLTAVPGPLLRLVSGIRLLVILKSRKRKHFVGPSLLWRSEWLLAFRPGKKNFLQHLQVLSLSRGVGYLQYLWQLCYASGIVVNITKFSVAAWQKFPKDFEKNGTGEQYMYALFKHTNVPCACCKVLIHRNLRVYLQK